MTLNIPRFIRDLSLLNGIPETHLSAIVHRFISARKARDQIDEFQPLRKMGLRFSVVPDLQEIEREIEHADRLLARQIVEKSVEDYQRGLLERRVVVRTPLE